MQRRYWRWHWCGIIRRGRSWNHQRIGNHKPIGSWGRYDRSRKCRTIGWSCWEDRKWSGQYWNRCRGLDVDDLDDLDIDLDIDDDFLFDDNFLFTNDDADIIITGTTVYLLILVISGITRGWLLLVVLVIPLLLALPSYS